MRRAATPPTLLRAGEFFSELLDTGLDIRLKVFCTLVFGYGPGQFLESFQAFFRLPGVAVRLLGFLVCGRYIGWHTEDFTLVVSQ